MLNRDDKKKLADEIQKRVGALKCPMCNNRGFIIADGYFTNTMQADLNSVTLGGPGIPTVAVICNRCGFISQHALGVLGLLNESNKTNSDESK